VVHDHKKESVVKRIPTRRGGFLSDWYGALAVALSISLCTASYIWALAESSTRAYHSAGNEGRHAHLLHSEYLICWVLCAVVSTLLLYGRRSDDTEDAPALRLVISASMVAAGFMLEVSILILRGWILHMWKR
jgi:FtsH-binding integral membrane protein